MVTFTGTLSSAHDASESDGLRLVRLWLYSIAGLILAMVTVGGATRLTGSGLSITEWKPLLGAIPPLTDADWHDAFDKYRQITQYKLVNKGMSLADFKSIFWWEWSHRQLGRFIGAAFLLPFLAFLAAGRLPATARPKLWGLFALGGLQGVMGWYMVQSGLSERIDVSQYRLAAHLTLAALIYAGVIWVALDLTPAARRVRLRSLPRGAATAAGLLLALVLLQLFLGALVAGMKAGLTHNTWPLMDDRLIPTGLFVMSPWWANLFENATTVQFDHRMLGYVIAALALWQGLRVARAADDEQARATGWLLVVAVLVQVGLGVWTLLRHVPLGLALAHQAMAMIVLALAVWHRHAVMRS